jgi:membrane-bound lytic murein transglycosylase D
MRIRAGSTVLIPKTSQRPGDISLAMAENGSLSLDKPAPPAAQKCAKGAKCPVVKSTKGATKGNSSANNAASQHKSASTGLAKSAKNSTAKASSSTAKVSNSKGASKIQ